MAPRPAARRERDNVDYSAVGKQGRRTGVTLEPRPLDKDGMEEITGIFSSPRKPSPLKTVMILDSVEEAGLSITPKQQPSAKSSTRHGSLPPPRSSSPRKSGISGTARKGNGANVFSTRKSLQPHDPEDRENEPNHTTPIRNAQLHRFSQSPEISPLRDITSSRSRNAHTPSIPTPEIEHIFHEDVAASTADEAEDNVEASIEEAEPVLADASYVPLGNDDDGDDDAAAAVGTPDVHGTPELLSTQRPESEELETPSKVYSNTPRSPIQDSEPQAFSLARNEANSRRKRTSDVFEQDNEVAAPSNSTSKKARNTARPRERTRTATVQSKKAPSAKAKGKQPLRENDANMKMSSRQEKELDDYVEKIRARPGPPRSLYVLRRETPADDTVTHTRSGRLSVKPLAYWRNERCIYGGSPGGGALKDGARFPLNSIKEIVRTEELPQQSKAKKKSTKANRKRGKAPSKDDDSSSESELDEGPQEDPYAEAWETETGTFHGNVSLWDQPAQTAAEEEETIELAHAPAAIQTREVKGSSLHEGPTFKYAKLLSTKFFGTGIVDLAPGGYKRPKNSRKMHMSFFVVKGRVTVTVGPVGSEEQGTINRFSIGKGGFWQVPRGNQYSIENELDKPARIFFSQGCEPTPVMEEDN
ncbi:hypothetical protein B0A52_08987 [Exophiala mesophila]|uniref:CENP-C homolog n=1 Tax=Exophiala mesophila TaxID=212818 RepID=A0A438MSY0_EXOME|nr:hypothetical protein B0A52_08987 [Exophiala mesophila]